ncbi:hypothetical protein SAY86_012253 [Trapa natans]|uniref:Uncharacterized protein n=1 Tax=Trapa natans TaxID=22666 RepID=A0AAN7LXP4_TRANT|nr:hypothetical protein SAY86_012253 [Trapa natans]
MKAYMRKQANSKTIKKHMRNGGIASFNFHSSPRMIPHIFKPEVQFVELSIEKFVPRGKRVKEDQFTEPQRYREILTTEEANLISKYFKNTENRWKPSLIAFPHFQTFPSSVHKVTHSSRTGMLIDSMQLLQGHIFSSTKDEEEAYSFPQMDAPLVEKNIWDEKDSRSIESPDMNTEMWPASSTRIKGIADKHELLELQHGNHPTHSSLFGSDFVAVDTLGNVSILLVPPFYIMEASHTKHNAISVEQPKYLMTDNEKSHISAEPTKLQARTAKDASEQPLSPNFSVMIETRLQFGLHEPNWQNGPVDAAEKSMERTYVDEMPREMDSPICTPDGIVVKGSLVDDAMETELSPRLTNYIESGVVPESPVGGTTKAIATSEFQEFQEMDILETPKRAKISTRFLSTSSSPNSVKFEKAILDPLVSEGNASHSPATDRKDFVVDSVKHGASERCDCGSSEGEISPETPPSGCCSRDWYFTPRDEGSIKQPRKLKRLRKIGEVDSHAHLKYQKNYVLSCGAQSKVRGKKTRYKNGRAYIEEEAEVSSGADTSGEEEDGDGEDDSYDDSFMDDRINPTAGSPHAAVTSSIDMMAIYRRSLLSQSPMAWQPNNNTTPDPHSVAVATTSGSAYSSETRTAGRISSEDAMNPPGFIPEAGEASKVWNRKRKLGAEALDSLAALNLEELLIDGGEVVGEEVIDGGEVVGEEEKGEGECDPFSDDQFYDDIDLDEVEAHATLLLKHKPEPPRPDQGVVVPVKDDSINTDCLVSPSFDLGI